MAQKKNHILHFFFKKYESFEILDQNVFYGIFQSKNRSLAFFDNFWPKSNFQNNLTVKENNGQQLDNSLH